MKLNSLFLPLALIFMADSNCHGQAASINKVNADLLRRFESEAPKAWQETKEDYFRFFMDTSHQRDTILEHFHLPAGKEKGNLEQHLDHRNLRLNLGEDFGVFKGGLEDGNAEETVAFYNRSYYALIQRKKGSTEWLLKNIGELPEHDSEMPLPEALEEIDRSLFYAADPLSSSIHPFDENPFIREHTSQESALAWPDLRDREIIGIDYMEYNGREMVRVVLTFTAKAVDWTSKVNNTYQTIDQHWKSTAIFDPANHWCLNEVSGGAATDGKFVYEYKRIYSYSEVNGVQICDKYAQTRTWKDTDTVTDRVERANALTKVDLSPEDFTLSAFGLPEPAWYRPPTPWWLYTSIAGLALMIVGAALFLFGKKKLSAPNGTAGN